MGKKRLLFNIGINDFQRIIEQAFIIYTPHIFRLNSSFIKIGTINNFIIIAPKIRVKLPIGKCRPNAV
jgi:hypothetical protein